MALIHGDAWKFKPSAEIRYEEDNDVLNFVREFIRYLNDDGCKRKVKDHFDARCREVAEKNQSMYYTQFFPYTIIKQCIMECTDRDALCQSINFPLSEKNKMRMIDLLGTKVANLLSCQSHRDLYRDLCRKLGIKVAVGFSLVSPEPYVSLESSLPRRQSINPGLMNDRQSFRNFIDHQPYTWYSSIFDRHKNIVLPKGDMRSPEQFKAFIRGANLENLPGGSEIIIYFAGHGGRENGNWVAYTKMSRRVISFYVTMEVILDLWIEMESPKASQDYLILTIISDCCFSNKWVQRLKEDIDNGVNGSKYGHYPICIQGAASGYAYENTLLPALIQNVAGPLRHGQDPMSIFTDSYKSALLQQRLLGAVKLH